MKKIGFFLVIIIYFNCNSSVKKLNKLNNRIILSKTYINHNTNKQINKDKLDFSLTLAKETRFDQEKEVKNLVSKLLGLFDKKFVSMWDVENIFGNTLVEEEYLFFKECDLNNSAKICNQLFRDCVAKPKNCKSYIFEEIMKSKLINVFCSLEDTENVINSLQKIKDREYHSKLKGTKLKFLFTHGEDGNELIMRDFLINNTSIFRGVFNED